jgi:hypothetical protein
VQSIVGLERGKIAQKPTNILKKLGLRQKGSQYCKALIFSLSKACKMKPKATPCHSLQRNLIYTSMSTLVNPRHPLVKLADSID